MTANLGGVVAIVDKFGLTDDAVLGDWRVVVDPTGPRIALAWEVLTITVRDRGDLELARRVARERTEARQAVDRIVMAARRALGWGRGEPYVRCVVCRTEAPASWQHRPGSKECADTREERRLAHSDWTPE